MTEWAIMQGGEIVNVCTTDGAKPRIELYPGADEIVNLKALPLSVLRRYRYWDERP